VDLLIIIVGVVVTGLIAALHEGRRVNVVPNALLLLCVVISLLIAAVTVLMVL
jgi:hypothetical protein